MSKFKIGDILKNNQGLEFEVISKISNDCFNIKFSKSTYATKAYFHSITSGKVSDYLTPRIFGVACLGYGSRQNNLRAYAKWYKMLSRCYNVKDKNYHQYGGNGIFVCDRWYRFDYFLEDLPHIEGYDEVLFAEGKLQLDKDIKQFKEPTKVYDRENCCFVSCKNNNQYREYSLQKEFIAKSPDGDIYVDKNIRQFSKKHKLSCTHVSRCLRGLALKHKGWVFRYKNKIQEEN